MSQITVKLNKSVMNQVGIAAANEDLKRRATRVLNAARSNCPVDRGTLRSSLAIEYNKGPGGIPIARIGSKLPYAIFVERGTGIYGPKGIPIHPKKGKFLVFTPRNFTAKGKLSKSGKVFTTSVKGMPARPYLEPALSAAAY